VIFYFVRENGKNSVAQYNSFDEQGAFKHVLCLTFREVQRNLSAVWKEIFQYGWNKMIHF